ncbi:MAG TPA: hypothetical protein VK171_13115, partial [Fimbriimonas sp.]|nr:hypothetical protein [Fimbriimonas sp.]
MKSVLGYILAALLIASCAAAYCQFIVEPDNFYHLAHARHYWEQGPFNTDFPYAAYSAVAEKQSDLWWGFHVLLSPLTLIPDKTLLLAVAPGVMLFLYMLICRAVMTTLQLNPWFGLAMLPASGSFFQRMDTVRPQALSAPLLLLVAAGLAANSISVTLIAAAAIGILHPTLSYMVVLVALASLFAKRVTRAKGKLWAELLAPVVAMGLACVRPNPIAGLELLKIQLFDLFMVKKAGEVTNFGSELAPATMNYFMSAMLGPII